MAREKQLVHELNQIGVPDVPILSTNLYDSIKDSFLRCLREMFTRHPEYTYVPDPARGWGYPDLDKTKIVIWEDYALETLFLPAITINIGSVREHPVSFNQNLGTVDYLYDEEGNQVFDDNGHPIPVYFECAGAWDVNFNVVINAESPWDRDMLADFVTINIMHVWRDWLYTRGIHVKTLNVGGEELVQWRNDNIYKSGIACELYTEWTHRIPISGDTIKNFSLSIGSPISSSALVEDGVVRPGSGENYEGKDVQYPSSSTAVTTIDRDLDLRPDSSLDTISFNATTTHYEITDEWKLFIAQWFDSAELQTRYNIATLNDLTVGDWFDMLAQVSSPARLGFPTLMSQLETAITDTAARLNLDPTLDYDGYGGTTNELSELQDLLNQLTQTYQTDVTRYKVG